MGGGIFAGWREGGSVFFWGGISKIFVCKISLSPQKKTISACGGRTRRDYTPCNINYYFLLNISRRNILAWVGHLKNLQENILKEHISRCLEKKKRK
jgi:hypothetical protein